MAFRLATWLRLPMANRAACKQAEFYIRVKKRCLPPSLKAEVRVNANYLGLNNLEAVKYPIICKLQSENKNPKTIYPSLQSQHQDF